MLVGCYKCVPATMCNKGRIDCVGNLKVILNNKPMNRCNRSVFSQTKFLLILIPIITCFEKLQISE